MPKIIPFLVSIFYTPVPYPVVSSLFICWSVLFCFPTASPFLSVPENNNIVCNGTHMILSCTVFDTAALRWIVGSTLITCPGNVRFQSGSPCLGGTAKVYAIVTSLVHRTRFPVPRSDITSSITITNISHDTEVRCENQIEERQTSEILHVSSMLIFVTFLSDIDKHKSFISGLY